MIISRYLIRETLQALAAVTLMLLVIFMSQQLIRLLSYAATGKLAANILLQFAGFEIPYLLALLLPLGMYLGIILVYGRLYAENELPVMQACGFSKKQLFRITMWIALWVSGVVMMLMLWVNPYLAAEKAKLVAHSMATENILSSLVPGRFQITNDGKRVVYVESMSRDHQHANNLFIADQDASNHSWTVLSATQGSQMKDKATQGRFVVANSGYRYQGVPGQKDYQIIQFKKYAVRLEDTITKTKRQEEQALSTYQLWSDYQKPENAAELQWRLSIPISVLLLALLAVPLSHLRPRQGKYSALLPAVLLYIVYINLLFVARDWVEAKLISPYLGMWWVHAIVLLLLALFIKMQIGRESRSV